MEEIAACYRLLELEPGASLAAAKQAYRELVKVWHPDRFPNDPKFQKRATEKTQQINKAFAKIEAYLTGRSSEGRAEAAKAAREDAEARAREEARKFEQEQEQERARKAEQRRRHAEQEAREATTGAR